jgi:hypothetical protein
VRCHSSPSRGSAAGDPNDSNIRLSNSQAAGAFRALSILEKCQYMSINVNKVAGCGREQPQLQIIIATEVQPLATAPRRRIARGTESCAAGPGAHDRNAVSFLARKLLIILRCHKEFFGECCVLLSFVVFFHPPQLNTRFIQPVIWMPSAKLPLDD